MVTEPVADRATGQEMLCERYDNEGRTRFVFRGALTLDTGPVLWRQSEGQLKDAYPEVEFDLESVTTIDGGIVAILVRMAYQLESTGSRVFWRTSRESVASLVDLYRSRMTISEEPHRDLRRSFFTQVGESALLLGLWARDFFEYIGLVIQAFRKGVRNPRTIGWSHLSGLMERAGADATVIVLLINFLVGLIMAYQSSEQLANFGANIFVANLVGLAMVRELGPLMTAIIVTGRSGAGFAAELGTMKVSEEIDALRAMGFCPFRYLVFPRVFALAIVMPLLAMMGNLVGILGGFLVGVFILELTPVAFIQQTESALDLWDIGTGLIKSIVFGFLIALIACQKGLWTRGGAEGVGRSTTAAVVKTLFTLVLVDAAFTVLFQALGI